ncbi:ferredoxin [Desulfonatronum parangueonense]
MARQVYVDWDECIGCESCVEICPEVFKMTEDGSKAEVILPEGGPEDQIEEAMDTCPVQCIHWQE